MSEQDPFKIVIAGGGTAGWMAASLLARFSPAHFEIELVESETIGSVGVGEATIPQIRHFNQALGIDEAEFLRETKGSFKLGIAFDGWMGDGHSYMHAFGQVGRGAGLLPFHQHWLRARKLGHARPLAHYSLNEIAARALRMPAPGGPELPYAYHFDAGLYAAFLCRFAEARGVTRTEGLIENVERNGETGDIAAIALDGDRRIEGDLFIDCTGFRGLLIEGAMEAGFDDWSHLLPCDRAVAVPCSGGGDFTPYTRSIAREAGWQWRIPLQHRIGNGYVFSSAHISEDKAAEALLANLDGEADGTPRVLKFTTGKRHRQWVGNCIALGLAAGFMEPLESTSIHLVQSALARVLQLLPSGRPDPALVDHFNAQADFEWTRIRDFLVLHYWANGREGQPFWDAMRALDLPDTLSAKIEQWRAGGHIHREHEELFTEVAWFQVLAGQGVEADSYNPLADAVPENELVGLLASTEEQMVRAANAMPQHVEVLGKLVSQAARKEKVA
ncbi:tryptophan halogenase family protein [Qipengyuania aquimaris]|uniref:Tryptophan 7-halogenase n=1 Tax=Qipengyuania aquimaris TaxID=255984 RepID=A0A9Q3RZ61_9SPHN|nr:tryptophan halogenase family protein [Qipengyuania aquimaris]MBY6217141.1 tryptophan 7-halogenase [Qipengyuania aquimaris]